MHEASRHATAWRFVEVQDEKLALGIYYPKSPRALARANPMTYWTHIPSDSLLERLPDIQFPRELEIEHPWREPMNPFSSEVAAGEMKIDCLTDGNLMFQWQSWWNSYSLFVLIRRPPRLALLKSFLSAPQN